MLPAASAAYCEMVATGRHTYLSGSNQALDAAVGIAFALFQQLYVGNVAWCGKRHKHDQSVYTCEGIPFGGDIGYLYMLQYRELLAFS